MSTSPIPPRDQLDLFPVPTGDGSGASSQQDDALHLLLEVQDELTTVRRREAAWISIAVHAVLILLLANVGYLSRFLPHRPPLALLNPNDILNQKDLTYLEMSPNDLKRLKPPDTNIISDKNRVSASLHPDQKMLKQMRDSARPELPAQQQTPAAPAPQPQQQAQSKPEQPIPQPDSPPQDAKLQLPQQQPQRPSFRSAMSAGAALDQATRAVAQNRGGFGGSAGDIGPSSAGGGREESNLEVLSDTMGVDFGPYLQRVVHDVRIHWYDVIPEIARPPVLKKGRVVVDFVILKDGKVTGMRVAGPSGDISFDRAAWSGITASNPFPPLPSEFHGEYLQLRFHFYYNPESNELR